MSKLLEPSDKRNRGNYDHPVPQSLKHIFTKNAGPRLQFQFNDKNNKCIGESMVLKPENENLHGKSFVPRCNKNDNRLKIPDNAKSILIFGQQGIFASQDDLKGAYRKDWSEPKPTQGIEITGPLYLFDRPYNFIIAQFDLETGERNSSNYVKDIVKTIEFSNGIFSNIQTIEPINVIR